MSSKKKKPKVDFKNVSKHFDTSDFEDQVLPRVPVKKLAGGAAINDTLREYPAKAPQQKSGGGQGRAKDYVPLDRNDFKNKLEKIKKQKANVKTV
jgi:hypothetical protein